MTGRVTITDVRRAGYCVAGARRWFEGYGFDFRQFVRSGCPVDEFLARSGNDAHARRVIEVMEARRG